MRSSRPIVLIVALLVTCTGCSDRVQVDCNGTPKFVYKDPERFFPDYVKSYDVSASVDPKIEAALTTVSAAYKDQVIKLIAELDKETTMFRSLVKAAFVDFNLNPCDPVSIERFRLAQDRMTEYFLHAKEEKEYIAETAQAIAATEGPLTAHVDTDAVPPELKDTTSGDMPNGWRALVMHPVSTDPVSADSLVNERLAAYMTIREQKLSVIDKLQHDVIQR